MSQSDSWAVNLGIPTQLYLEFHDPSKNRWGVTSGEGHPMPSYAILCHPMATQRASLNPRGVHLWLLYFILLRNNIYNLPEMGLSWVMGVPQKSWFTMETPNLKWMSMDDWGYHDKTETSIWSIKITFNILQSSPPLHPELRRGTPLKAVSSDLARPTLTGRRAVVIEVTSTTAAPVT